MWIDVDQNTDEWLELRIGKITSSNFSKIMANDGKAFGNPAIEYAQKIALEIVTGKRDERGSYSNKFMEDGKELEPVAIQLYEIEQICSVTKGGFNVSDCQSFGDSPDGNVGDIGCIEVKSVIASTQWKVLKSGGFDTAYKWQINGHLWLGKKEWCDFISFCPEMPENKRLHIFRVYRDEVLINDMVARLSQFKEEVDKCVKFLQS